MLLYIKLGTYYNLYINTVLVIYHVKDITYFTKCIILVARIVVDWLMSLLSGGPSSRCTAITTMFGIYVLMMNVVIPPLLVL